MKDNKDLLNLLYSDDSPIDPDKEYQISELVEFILSKMDGKDVRAALAFGLKKAYEDAAESGNANMEVAQARGFFNNLNARLQDADNKHENTTRQLAQTEEKVNKTKPIYIYERIPESTAFMGNDEVLMVYNNLIELESYKWKEASITGSTGEETVSDTRVLYIKPISVEPNATYKIMLEDGYINVFEYSENDEYYGSTGWLLYTDTLSVTTQMSTRKIKVLLANNSQNDSIDVDYPQNISKPIITRIY